MMGRLTMAMAMAMIALISEPICASRLSSDNLEFELRALEMGMDVDYQATIDKRAFEQKGVVDCAAINVHCDPPKLSESVCKYGYNPKIKVSDENGCSCISEYECCGASCPVLTEKEWKICENPKKYGIGKFFPVETEDCCDCKTVICLPCMKIVLAKPGDGVVGVNNTHRHFHCENECDEPHEIADPDTGCPDYVCKPKPAPAYDEPKCNSSCHKVETKKDSCGHDYDVCKCIEHDHCTPDEPEEKNCLITKKVHIDEYSCNPADKTKCFQCHKWNYAMIPGKDDKKVCKKCEAKVRVFNGCHSLDTKCECRVPTNCHPEKPTPPPCTNAVRVEEPDSTMCDHSQRIYECIPCYHWDFVPVMDQMKCLLAHYQG